MAKRRKKSSKKTAKRRKVSKKRRTSISRIENAIEKVLSRKYTVAIDGSRHNIGFPGHHKKARKKKRMSHAQSSYIHSAEAKANLARGRAIRKARLSGKHGFIGPIEDPIAKSSRTYAKRIAALAKARSARRANIAMRHAGII